jgi:SAM-dependent methyltransferase
LAEDFSVPPGQEESLGRMAEAANYNEWLLERARPYVGRRVLDFGAGIGTFTAAVATTADVVAVEPDPEFAPRLRDLFSNNPRVTVVETDAGWLADGMPTDRFDTILCFNVLEHIADDTGVLTGFHDRLVGGGHLLLLVPAHQLLYGKIDENVGHERRYGREHVRRLLEDTGLTPLDVRYVNPLGAVGWLVSSRILRRQQVPAGPLRAYDRLVPILQRLDRLPLPFGLSVWAVARRASE